MSEKEREKRGLLPPEGGSAIPAPHGLRWTASRKAEVVLRLLRGEPIDAVSREIGVEAYRLDEWRARALAGAEASLKSRSGDARDDEIDRLRGKVGELTMENEILRMRCEKTGPFAKRRSSP